jgi:phosphopantothenoylcysteine decarboxylase/phosphopantothenate--cysteine ligase
MAEVTSHDAATPDAGRPFVVLGVAAGIAAYKSVEICRRLVDAGVHVAPVLTERATRFVGRATFDALGSEPTQMTVWDEASPIPHTRLGQKADLIVVAPATADLLARYAAGLADDLLTTTLLARPAPWWCARPCTPRCGSTPRWWRTWPASWPAA